MTTTMVFGVEYVLVSVTHRRAHRLFLIAGGGGFGCDLCGGA